MTSGGWEGEVRFLLSVSEEIDVDELSNFEIMRSYIFDYLGKVFRHVSTF